MTIYGLGVNLCNMRLIDNGIRFSSTKDEEWAQMDTMVGSTTKLDASKRKTAKPFSRLWNDAPLSWRSISPAAEGSSFIRVVMIIRFLGVSLMYWGEDVYID